MHKFPREELSEKDLKAALDNCAQEPIHIPGSIQPHGLLVVFCPKMKVIEHISDNAESFLGKSADQVLGHSVTDIFGEKNADILMSATTKSPLEPLESSVVSFGGKTYDAVASRWDDKTIVEFEPQPDAEIYSSDKFYYDQLRNFAIDIREAKNADDLYLLIVQKIFKMTGIDRVKLYQFDEEWNGEVVAEAKTEYMPSYLGQHFPASDIPEQARKLYMKSYLRIIPDISYKPSAVLPAFSPQTGKPVDLSQSILRSVSPVHVQYLDNMNVRASMSISIIQNGRLWGLIACHHNSPLYVPYRIRMIAEVIGHIFSVQLSNMQEMEKNADDQKRTLLLEKLSVAIKQNPSLNSLFMMIAPLAMEALKSTGLALYSNNQIFIFGATPDTGTLSSLFAWLREEDINDLLYTDNAQNLVAGKAGLRNLDGGFLALRVTLVGGDYAVWFRPGMLKEMHWAGNPEKSAEATKAGYRLTPRSSFSLWKENVKGKCLPWAHEDIHTAQNVVKIFIESKQVTADQANIAKSEFMANLSHELRTPMNAILGLASILVNSQPLSEKQRVYLNTLKGSADNLLTLINDLLDIAKIEAGTVELETVSFDLPRLVQEIISMMSVRAVEKGLKFNLDVTRLEGHFYVGDPTRLRQVLINLIGNALKFTDQGEIKLKLHSSLVEEDKYSVGFEIQDTGIGIEADKIAAIFEKFTQADATISRRFGGTGLGLSITKTLVELMGGEISVKSEIGKGSVFSFAVPLQKSLPQPKKSGETVAQDANKPNTVKVPKILVVEDFEPNALVVCAFLEEFGYEYDHARNGLEAIELVKANEYFAILMDVQMHGMNGFDATEAIRKMESEKGDGKSHYIIGITAHALAGDRDRCYAAGMDDYMSKPFNPKELKSKLLTAVFSKTQK